MFRLLRHLNLQVHLVEAEAFEAYENSALASFDPYSNRNGGVLSIHGSTERVLRGKNTRDYLQLILHEVGHFLVAHPKRRRKSNYGARSSFIKGVAFWDLEEVKARIVEAYLCRHFGITDRVLPKAEEARYNQQLPAALEWWERHGVNMVLDVLQDSGLTKP